MLDFFILADEHPEPDESTRLEFAGGIDLEHYHRLIRKGILEARFSYFEDFRWSRAYVLEKYEEVKLRRASKDTDLNNLYSILEKAVQKKSGLFVYCD